MSRINQNILSEIQNFPKTTDEMKEFLKWILTYERDHAERQLSFYKTDIEKKLDEMFLVKKI